MGRAARWVGFGAAVLAAACGEVVPSGLATPSPEGSRAADAARGSPDGVPDADASHGEVDATTVRRDAGKPDAASPLHDASSRGDALTPDGPRSVSDADAPPDARGPDAPFCAEVCTGTCAPGGCLVTLAPAMGEGGIAADATNVYWANWYDPAVMRVPKAGGTPVTLAAVAGNPCGVGVDEANVYWVSRGDIEGDPATVTRVPATGGTPTTLVTEPSEGNPFALALTDTNIYWVDSGNSSLTTVSKDGGTAVTLAAPGGYGALSIALAGGNAYWNLEQPSPAIVTAPLSGGPLTTLSPGGLGVATDATGVYWTTGSGSVLRAAVDGGSLATIATESARGAALAVDATNVYWSGGALLEGGAVYTLLRAPKSGGTPTTLFASEEPIWSIVPDAPSLYVRTNLSIERITPTCACE